MSHPNEVAIRKAFGAFMRGDIESGRPMFSPDVVWHISGRGALSGDFRGFDEVVLRSAPLIDRRAGAFQEDLVDVFADDKMAVQSVTYRAERDGRTIEDRSVNIYRMQDGVVVECWVVFSDSQGFDKFFSRDSTGK